MIIIIHVYFFNVHIIQFVYSRQFGYQLYLLDRFIVDIVIAVFQIHSVGKKVVFVGRYNKREPAPNLCQSTN